MCGARPDGRHGGVGVTETPLIDLPAELGKCGHCAWTTLREHCITIMMARKLRVIGLMPTDRC